MFVLAVATLVTKLLSALLEKLRIFKRLNKVFSWVYFLLFNVMYYDFQIIIFTELTRSQFFSKKDGKINGYIILSFFASFLLGLLMVAELWKINVIFKKKRKEFRNPNANLSLKSLIQKKPNDKITIKKVKKYLRQGISYSDTLLISKFTEDVNPYYILVIKGNHYKFQIVFYTKTLLMMYFVSSMQMMENCQVVTLFLL